MDDKFETLYKGAKITFDIRSEEWVAKLNEKYVSGEDTFKSHKSLQKLKDSIDRFNKKNFKEIPVLIFADYGKDNLKNADIISFTEKPGECWLRYHDGSREKLDTSVGGNYRSKRIYACGNIVNEPILKKISDITIEIKDAEKKVEQLQKEKIHLIDSLTHFDIGGYVETPELE